MQCQISHPRAQAKKRSAAHLIYAPQDHEGVGNALRSAYLPRISDMPQDLSDLLDKLN